MTDIPDTPMIEESAKYINIEKEYTEQKRELHESQYFIMGNNKLVINEHFENNGKPIGIILEKVILKVGNRQKTV